MSDYYKNDAQKRLWQRYIEPFYKALGEVLSTDAGKTIYRLCADAYRSNNNLYKVYEDSRKKHPTRKEQRYWGDFQHVYGSLCAYRRSLIYLICEASDGAISDMSCNNMLNSELAEYTNC